MVDTIKRLCKEKKTTIAAIERACGFGNGSIRKWDSASPAYERIKAVADFLGVSVSEITSDQKENPAPKRDGLSEIDAIFEQLTPSRQAKLLELARLYLADQRRNEETQ